jgi:polysaccharide chain length determinant protein (PEP-CTERM system associated)
MGNIASVLTGGWRRRYLIAIPVLLLPLAGALVGLLAPKKYESYTTVLIQETASQNPFLEDLAVATNLKKRMEAMNALLHSKHVLGEVVDELEAGSNLPEGRRQEMIARLSYALRATLVGEDLVRISYFAGAPEHMARVLELVSRRFIDRVVAPQRSSISSSEEFLESELLMRKTDLAEAEKRLADYKTRFAGELPDLHSSNVNRLADLAKLLAEKELELAGEVAARDGLHRKLSQTNPVVGRIEEQIVETMSELAVLRARYTDRHTKVQAALRRLDSLENERTKQLQAGATVDPKDLERLWNIASSQRLLLEDGGQTLLVSQLEKLQDADSRIQRLEQETGSLRRDVAMLGRKVDGFGRHEQQLTELERDLGVKRKIFQELSERYQNARVTGALGRWEESDRVKVIDAPFTPRAPTNLPLLVFVVAGLFGGFALGCALAVVAELADTSIRRRVSLERLLDIRVVARIPPLPETHGDNPAPDTPAPDTALPAPLPAN